MDENNKSQTTSQKAPINHLISSLPFYEGILRDICREEQITLSWLSNNWLALLEKNGERHFIMGYKFDLNSAIAADIADDKFATFDVLSRANIPAVKHALLYEIGNNDICAQGKNTLEYVHDFYRENQNHIVIKPNNGTRGINVYEIRLEDELMPALKKIFHQSYSASMCPFYQIYREYRLIMLDGVEKIAYYKEREGDWRFNLQCGAKAHEIKDAKLHQKLHEIAVKAIKALEIRFCSIDIIETVEHKLLVLEVNSGVMVDGFLDQHPDKYAEVYEMYHEAIRKMFGDSA